MKKRIAMSDASKKHAETCGEIHELIEQIQTAVFDATPSDRSRINFAHVGSMQHLKAMLKDALRFIGETAR